MLIKVILKNASDISVQSLSDDEAVNHFTYSSCKSIMAMDFESRKI